MTWEYTTRRIDRMSDKPSVDAAMDECGEELVCVSEGVAYFKRPLDAKSLEVATDLRSIEKARIALIEALQAARTDRDKLEKT